MIRELIEWHDFKDEQPQDGRGVYVKNVEYETIFTGYMRNGTLISGDCDIEEYGLKRGYLWAYRSRRMDPDQRPEALSFVWRSCQAGDSPGRNERALLYITQKYAGGTCHPAFNTGFFDGDGMFHADGFEWALNVGREELARRGFYWVPLNELIPETEKGQLQKERIINGQGKENSK